MVLPRINAGIQFLEQSRAAGSGGNLVPLSQNGRLRAHTPGVCFASRTGRPPLLGKLDLGRREARFVFVSHTRFDSPGGCRPLAVLIGDQGKAAATAWATALL